ncbi:MAG: hypothetical protein ABIP79_03185 [Chitinophagaceae bacterium]
MNTSTAVSFQLFYRFFNAAERKQTLPTDLVYGEIVRTSQQKNECIMKRKLTVLLFI